MAPPLSPQNASLGQRSVLALIRMLIALLVVIVGVLVLSGSRVGWAATSGLIGVTLAFTVMCISFLPPARTAMENLQAHSQPDGKHRCQCLRCGGTFKPRRRPTEPRGRSGPTPQEKSAAAESGIKGYRIALLVSFLGLVSLVVLVTVGAVDWTDPIALLAAVVLYVVLTAGLVVGMLLATRQLASARTQLAALDADHGCACRWCGATSR